MLTVTRFLKVPAFMKVTGLYEPVASILLGPSEAGARPWRRRANGLCSQLKKGGDLAFAVVADRGT